MSYTKPKHFPTGISRSYKKTQFMAAESIAYGQDYSHRPGEKPMQWLNRIEQETRQRRLEESQIKLNNELANQARQNRNKKYEIKQKGNKFIIEED